MNEMKGKVCIVTGCNSRIRSVTYKEPFSRDCLSNVDKWLDSGG